MQGDGAGTPACETVNVWPATVNVPDLAAPVFAATVNATLPLPIPDVPLVIVIHAAFDVAFHVQVLVVVTVVDPLAPAASTFWLEGAIA